MHDAGAWWTGRRRRVRAATHLLTAFATATVAWGFLVGEARRACKCEEPEPPARLLTHGGALALAACAVIAALTWASWRARLDRALATTGGALGAWGVIVMAWYVTGRTAPDAAAHHAFLATILLGALLVARMPLDAVLDWLQQRANARPRPAPLPRGDVRRGG